jgi:hypothetical protein
VHQAKAGHALELVDVQLKSISTFRTLWWNLHLNLYIDFTLIYVSTFREMSGSC